MKKLIILCLFAIAATSAKAQILNPDFEDWYYDSFSFDAVPTSWMEGIQNHCYQENNAYHGNYALRVSVWYYYVKTVAVQKNSISTRPLALEGYYKYTDNRVNSLLQNDTIADTAIAAVLLTKWNTTTMVADTIGFGRIWLHASSAYQHFSCPVNYTSAAVPDSVTVIFDPSIVRRYANATTHQSVSNGGISSFLTIDNLSLQQFPTGITAQAERYNISIYPNPASNYIHVDLRSEGTYTVSILDMTGRVIKHQELNGENTRIPLYELTTGIYEVVIADKNQHIVKHQKLAITK